MAKNLAIFLKNFEVLQGLSDLKGRSLTPTRTPEILAGNLVVLGKVSQYSHRLKIVISCSSLLSRRLGSLPGILAENLIVLAGIFPLFPKAPRRLILSEI